MSEYSADNAKTRCIAIAKRIAELLEEEGLGSEFSRDETRNLFVAVDTDNPEQVIVDGIPGPLFIVTVTVE